MSSRPAPRAAASRKTSKSAAAKVAARPKSAARAAGKLTASLAAINDQVSQEALTPPKKPVPATRRGKKGLVVYVDKTLPAQLRRLSGLTGLSVQELALTALNMLFEKHGMAPFPIEARP